MTDSFPEKIGPRAFGALFKVVANTSRGGMAAALLVEDLLEQREQRFRLADDLDPAQASPLRVFLLAVSAAGNDSVRRMATDNFPAADLLEPAAEITSTDETTCAAVLALRFQMAALYLGLAAGTTGGTTTYAPVRPRE